MSWHELVGDKVGFNLLSSPITTKEAPSSAINKYCTTRELPKISSSPFPPSFLVDYLGK